MNGRLRLGCARTNGGPGSGGLFCRYFIRAIDGCLICPSSHTTSLPTITKLLLRSEQMSHYVPNTRIPTLVFATSGEASRHAALIVERVIREHNSAGRQTVLGLATGSTPVGLYRELIRLHREAGLDLSKIITFNLDEYFPMQGDDPHSYRRWMFETFFNHVNIKNENIHIPDGSASLEEVDEYCAEYELSIQKAGGIDIQILGIGRTGHIGFNEPGSRKMSRTRLVTLDSVTRRDAGAGFFGEENVPHRALTMGVGTILEARKIIIMAFGEHKAPIVAKTLENEQTESVTASFLQGHRDTAFLLDEAAGGELTIFRRPWEVSVVHWTPERIRQAVIWLALKVGKALLKLSEEDFREHHLYDLLREHGPAEALLGRADFPRSIRDNSILSRRQAAANHPRLQPPPR